MVGIITSAKRIRASGMAALVVAAALLSACQTKTAGLDADPMATASLSTDAPSFKKTEALSGQWKSDPSNVPVAISYAGNLEKLGQKATQIDVLRSTAEKTRGNAQAQSQIGRALLSAGDPVGAADALGRSAELNPRDSQALSALGAALDQQAKHAEAREKYEAALALAPNDIGVMNNLAMSLSLQGKLPESEKILRKAMAHPNAKAMPRIRQNLALVIGLQGRFDEAKQIASQDLPPDEVQANMAYLQQMLGRQNTWAQLKDQPG